LEFNHKPKGPFGIGISMKFKPAAAPALRHYNELDLEQEVVCAKCSLRYTIYGVFGYCPSCRIHNSTQILDVSLKIAEKRVAQAETESDPDVQAELLSDALSKAVAACDGFGRCVCRVHAAMATDPKKADRISFQNLSGARKHVQELFGIDFAASLDANRWTACCRAFQKRHLFAHAMGVIDAEYVAKAGDLNAVVGRKVRLQSDEVLATCATIRELAAALMAGLAPPRVMTGVPAPEGKSNP
jgi:hypothetical protein